MDSIIDVSPEYIGSFEDDSEIETPKDDNEGLEEEKEGSEDPDTPPNV
jgi:hypothetical protein